MHTYLIPDKTHLTFSNIKGTFQRSMFWNNLINLIYRNVIIMKLH